LAIFRRWCSLSYCATADSSRSCHNGASAAFICGWSIWAIVTSRGPLAAILPLFPRRLQFPIPVGLNLLLMPGEHVLWRDVPDGAVQTNVVVMLYVTLNQPPRLRNGSVVIIKALRFFVFISRSLLVDNK
jgi:hypothetical protein